MGPKTDFKSQSEMWGEDSTKDRDGLAVVDMSKHGRQLSQDVMSQNTRKKVFSGRGHGSLCWMLLKGQDKRRVTP